MVDGRLNPKQSCWAIVVECETFIIRGGVCPNLFLCMGKSTLSNLQTSFIFVFLNQIEKNLFIVAFENIFI